MINPLGRFIGRTSLEELLVEQSPDPIIAFDESGDILYANSATHALLSSAYDEFEIFARSVAQGGGGSFASNHPLAAFFSFAQRALQDTKRESPISFSESLELSLQDEIHKFHVVATPLAKDGENGVAFYLHPVPDAQIAEERVMRDRSGKIEYDLTGRIQFMNPAAQRMLNVADIHDRLFNEVFPAGLWGQLVGAFAETKSTGKPTPFIETTLPEYGTLGFYVAPLMHRGELVGFEQILTTFEGRGLDDLLHPSGKLGRYTLLNSLTPNNEGAYKVVWHARDDYQLDPKGIPQEVAILIFRPREEIVAVTAAGTSDRFGGTEELFRRELAALTRVRTEQVRGRKGFHYFPEFQTANRLVLGGRDVFYISLTYIPGTSLEQHLLQRHADRKMPLREVVKYGSQLFHALRAIHKLKLIHRDIKPSNIILTPDRNLRIIDLGIVHDENLPDITRGSKLYLAPEQFQNQGGRSYTGSDVWAASVVLYQTLTGQYPFSTPITDWSSLNPMQVAEQERILRENILHASPLAPPSIDSRASQPHYTALSELIMRGLNPDVGQRPTAVDLHLAYHRLYQQMKTTPKANGGNSI